MNQPKVFPLMVDFGDALAYRKDKGGGKNEAIAKAVGIKDSLIGMWSMQPQVWEQRFILASVGCRVTMLERANVVCALLADGLGDCRGGMICWLADALSPKRQCS